MDQAATRTADWLREQAAALSAALARRLPLGEPKATVEGDLRFLVEGLAAAVECGSAGLIDRHLGWQKVRVRALGGDPQRFEHFPAELLDAAAARGLPADDLARLGQVLQGAAIYLRFAPDQAPVGVDPEVAPGTPAGELLAAARRGDRLQARAVLDDRAAPADCLEQVLEPMLREVGRLWQNGLLTPPEEHLVSHYAHDALQRLQTRVPPAPAAAPLVALVRAHTDEHSLGQAFLELYLRSEGLRTRVLVAAAEPAATVRALVALAPAAVAISCTTPSHLRAVAALVAELRQHPALAACHVLLGGSMFLDVPQLATQLGADGGGAFGRRAAQALRAQLQPVAR